MLHALFVLLIAAIAAWLVAHFVAGAGFLVAVIVIVGVVAAIWLAARAVNGRRPLP